jgi:PAS domain-containing protein
VATRAPKNLILIIAREFASKLATATVLADAEGRIVYFNERAEVTLGRTFAEAGEMPAEEWAEMFGTEDVDGRPIGLDELPAGVALRDRTPAHGTFCITALDGVRRTLSTTAVPLFARADEFVGVMAVFWEHAGDGGG